jgi:hypothetical protein
VPEVTHAAQRLSTEGADVLAIDGDATRFQLRQRGEARERSVSIAGTEGSRPDDGRDTVRPRAALLCFGRPFDGAAIVSRGTAVVAATGSLRFEGVVMNITTRIRTDLSSRWKVLRFKRFLEHHTDSLTRRFGPAEATAMRHEMLEEYRALIPQLPDIGGRHNPWNSNLAATPMALAVYRGVLRHGGSAHDAGEVVVSYAHSLIEWVPRRVRPRVLAPRRSVAEKEARWSQQRRSADDWVTAFVDGTDQPFDFGMDVTECAILKYMRANGAEEFTPYLCHVDYVIAEAAGVGLTRTKTLAWGCDRCDFRFTNPGTTTTSWPPEFPERSCGRPAAPSTEQAIPQP